jgi:hypothetical protein
MQFWLTAFQHHTEAARKIAAVWNIALPMVAAAGAASGRAASSPPRDRLTFAETETADNGAPSQTVRTSSDRRSAA